MPRSPFLAAPSILLLTLATLVGGGSAGCRSTSTNVTGPSSAKCAVSLSGSGLTVPGEGGNGSVAVSINRECSWTATSQAAWITITGGANGQGPGTVTFAAAANAGAASRTGAVLVNQNRVDITQQGAPCTFGVDPSAVSVPSGGGEARLTVTGPSGCSWTAQSAAPWLTVSQGASGSGSGTVTLSAGPNTGAARSTTVTVAGRAVTVSQPTGGCLVTVTLSASSFGAGGGGGQANVTSAAGCEWTSTSNAAWLTIQGSSSGTGNGAVSFTVASNAGTERSATLTIGGQAFAVTQASGQGDCRVTLSPRSQSIPADGGSRDFNVSTGGGCSWNASTSASWLTITRGASGTGEGVVSVSAAANSGAERSATVSAGGDTVSVVQAATSCSFAVAPAGVTIGAAGGPTSVSVNTTSACSWTASSDVPWVAVTAGGSASGPGTVSFSVAANTGAAREGTVVVAGRTVTISQEGTSCTFSLTPTGVSAPVSGGTLSTTLNTTAGCAWTASSSDAWLTIVRGSSGTGTAVVEFTVAANTGAARTGTLTIAGIAFVVSQAAATQSCQFSISPASAAVAAPGGNATVNVSSGPGCAWTASSNAPWITIGTGASGSGNGTVTLSVAANTGASPRDGTVTVAGQTFTVTQAGAACTYALAPTGASATSSGGPGTVSVSAASGCVWTASSNVAWLSITGGASGSGNGTVAYSVTANPATSARSGTLTIAGLTFTVSQAGAACTYTVAPLAQTIAAGGGTGSVAVTTLASCAWTANSSVPWITITSGTSSTGNGTVTFSVAINTSGSPRSGTLTVGGQTATINQQ